jgi:hypothetical protein
MHFTGKDIEIRLGQRLHATVSFADASHLDDGDDALAHATSSCGQLR